jgi:hypothetical protein
VEVGVSSGDLESDMTTVDATRLRVDYAVHTALVQLRTRKPGDDSAVWIDLSVGQARELATRLRAAASMAETLAG